GAVHVFRTRSHPRGTDASGRLARGGAHLARDLAEGRRTKCARVPRPVDRLAGPDIHRVRRLSDGSAGHGGNSRAPGTSVHLAARSPVCDAAEAGWRGGAPSRSGRVSVDLCGELDGAGPDRGSRGRPGEDRAMGTAGVEASPVGQTIVSCGLPATNNPRSGSCELQKGPIGVCSYRLSTAPQSHPQGEIRSEEHTSELQSLT